MTANDEQLKPADNPSEGRVVSFKPGDVIIRENDVSRKMFIIRAGTARVFKTYLNHKVTIAMLGEGEIFGELAFFDAQPRCASVEAMTDVVLLELDGDSAAPQIARLPSWVFAIMRQVFHRFREMDQKITVLQSMNEYQKKVFKQDQIAKNVYLELLRFVRTFELLYQKHSGQGNAPSRDAFYQEFDDLLGSRLIGLKVFWRQLKEHDIIDNRAEETSNSVVLNAEALKRWKAYLDEEVRAERFLLLSHSSIAFLRRLIGFGARGESPNAADPVSADLDSPGFRAWPFRDEAVKELTSVQIIRVDGGKVIFDPAQVSRAYTFQSILKSFDHTVVNVD